MVWTVASVFGRNKRSLLSSYFIWVAVSSKTIGGFTAVSKSFSTSVAYAERAGQPQFFVAAKQEKDRCSFNINKQSKTSSSVRRFMSSEVEKAKEAAAAAAAADTAPPTIFDKLVRGEIPAKVAYQDDIAFCFHDVNPQAPVHILCIPKQRNGLTQLSKATSDQKDILGHLMYVASEVGKEHCPDGFRLVINDGKDGAQSVYHLHIHILGGRQMGWPPG